MIRFRFGLGILALILAMGIAAVLAGRLHRRSKAAGLLADGVIALLLTISAAYILLHSGESLRLYALLGMCIGGAAGCTCMHLLLRT